MGLRLITRSAISGLNRTSVGLKPALRIILEKKVGGLNRTSVGLKLRHLGDGFRIEERLNRTSVGLKPQKGRPKAGPYRWPQSNQRGIETLPHPIPVVPDDHASIEPAWD